MWNRPQLMKDVSDLLYVAAAALARLGGGRRRALAAVPDQRGGGDQRVARIARSEIERSLAGRLRGNFFSVNLEARQSLEQLPWVRRRKPAAMAGASRSASRNTCRWPSGATATGGSW